MTSTAGATSSQRMWWSTQTAPERRPGRAAARAGEVKELGQVDGLADGRDRVIRVGAGELQERLVRGPLLLDAELVGGRVPLLRALLQRAADRLRAAGPHGRAHAVDRERVVL